MVTQAQRPGTREREEETGVRTVLVPIALSSRAAAVAVEGHRWATLLGAKTVIVHVGTESTARPRIQAILDEHGLADAELVVCRGRPGAAVVEVAREQKADLIVAGALEKEGALTYFFGSVARQMARQAPCSVLLLKDPRVESHPAMRWVVSTACDEAGLGMLAFLAELARRAEPARIDVVTEYCVSGADWALEGDLDMRTADARRSGFHREEQGRLADFLAESALEGMNVRAVCLRGRVGHASAEYAREHGADVLFAMAPSHLGFWDRFIQHGVEFALESLPCALWLYRPRTTDPEAHGP